MDTIIQITNPNTIHIKIKHLIISLIFGMLIVFLSPIYAETLDPKLDPKNLDSVLHHLKTLPIKSVSSMRAFLISKGQPADFDNKVTLVTLSDGSKAVFKPVPTQDLGDAFAEVAAFKASQLLGFPTVPPTVIRKINHEIGSLQLYIEPALNLMDKASYDSIMQNIPEDDLANLKLFYFVFGQWDTGPHNLIVSRTHPSISVVAIDNSGIRNRQYVKYGQLPFVRICYSESLNTNDWDLPFPFQKAVLINKPTFEKLSVIFGNHFPEKTLKNLSKYKTALNYVIYKNSLWVQFHYSDPNFIISHSNYYPEKTMSILKNLNRKTLDKIFSEAKGAEFLTNEYLEAILERRDQVVKAFDNQKNHENLRMK